ncbi:MAG: MopE-related protein, partial [Myxococcota bacterium]
DCDGMTDEDYQPEATSCGVGACASTGETSCAGGEVVDSCTAGEPAASDSTCDGVDDDCDGMTDEDYQPEATSCGEGACASTGETSCAAGEVVDSCAPGAAAASDATCDGMDDDCDGMTDEDYQPEATSCGVGACASTGETSCAGGEVVDSCTAGEPAASDSTCDGVDDDCDGATDEDYQPTDTSCGVGACAATGQRVCQDGAEVDTCEAGVAGIETCDGVDDDCDGVTDEGDLCEDSNECTVDVCAGEDGCIYEPVETGTVCGDDGNACTASGFCEDGDCVTAGCPCPRTIGYWKNHEEVWPVDAMTLGGIHYDHQACMDILKSANSKDASVMLGAQLIAAKLNAGNGASTASVNAAIEDAEALLAIYIVGGNPEGADRDLAIAIKDELDAYNNSGVDDGTCPCDVDCDDGNACTTDACDPLEGCVHDPLAPGEGGEEVCGDGVDNDCDGLVDEPDACPCSGPAIDESWQAKRAESDGCHGGSDDHALWLPGFFDGDSSHAVRFTLEEDARLDWYEDDTARLYGTAVVYDTGGGPGEVGSEWYVDVSFGYRGQGSDSAGWGGPKKELKDSCQPWHVTEDWHYFDMVVTRASVVRVGDPTDGATFVQAPTNGKYTFQLGQAANGKNEHVGMSGWLLYQRFGAGEWQRQGDINVDLVEVEAPSCGGEEPSSAGSCCEAGSEPGCADEAVEACVCAIDSYCCDEAWDGQCVQEATCNCELECGGPDSESCYETHSAPGCEDHQVESCVCARDPYCCSAEWDAKCVQEATHQCGDDDDHDDHDGDDDDHDGDDDDHDDHDGDDDDHDGDDDDHDDHDGDDDDHDGDDDDHDGDE